MADNLPTTYMSLPNPIPGASTGPQYALDLQSCMIILDQHTHTPGSGQQLTPQSLNLNSDLPLNSNNLTTIRSLRFTPQSTALSTSGTGDIGCLYEAGVDLYYNDGSGNQIQLTQAGSIKGATGTITGLPSGTAGAAYSAGTFVFQSATNTSANLDGQSLTLRNNTANSHGMTLSPPSALGQNYAIVLPLPPASNTSFLQMDTSGNITAGAAVSAGLTTSNLSASAGILGSQLSSSAGIVGTQLVNSTITATQLANGIITDTKIQANSLTGASMAVNMNLPGSNVQVNSKPVVVSNSYSGSNIRILGVSINGSNGAITGGGGATCVRNSVGDYTVTWSTAFSATPVVTSGYNGTPSNTGIIEINTISTSSCIVLIQNGDQSFSIIAMGPI